VSRGEEPPRLIRFLIDSGAVYSVLPHDEWQALDRTLRPIRAKLAVLRAA